MQSNIGVISPVSGGSILEVHYITFMDKLIEKYKTDKAVKYYKKVLYR